MMDPSTTTEQSPLQSIETRIRDITPAKLYANVWINPSVKNLIKLFNHFRTLDRILYNYLPSHVVDSRPRPIPGFNRHHWEKGTLMFTDLAGFTPLLEMNSRQGEKGAKALHKVLNNYFSKMIAVISKSGGDLLEFTGDAMLIQFPADEDHKDTIRAVRAGLRMQQEMEEFSELEILGEEFSIGMRIGIHFGEFLAADIGTPHRMEHILLGDAVLHAKKAESQGKNGRVCLTPSTLELVKDEYQIELIEEGYGLIVHQALDDYEAVVPKLRKSSMILFDHSHEGLVDATSDALDKLEPFASFIPQPILRLLIENASSRGLPPDFPEPTLLFINLLGLPDNLHEIGDEDMHILVTEFSRLISIINAEIETHGGVMKKVTYHHAGPDIMAFFGCPNSHTNNTERAVKTARGIRSLVKRMKPIEINGQSFKIQSHIGLNKGQAFAAEIGGRQGRREYNVLGNTVNTAARLMDYAEANQIILSESVHDELGERYKAVKHPDIVLKGRSNAMTLWELS